MKEEVRGQKRTLQTLVLFPSVTPVPWAGPCFSLPHSILLQTGPPQVEGTWLQTPSSRASAVNLQESICLDPVSVFWTRHWCEGGGQSLAQSAMCWFLTSSQWGRACYSQERWKSSQDGQNLKLHMFPRALCKEKVLE